MTRSSHTDHSKPVRNSLSENASSQPSWLVASCDGRQLQLGTGGISRRWLVGPGWLSAQSLVDHSGKEWLVAGQGPTCTPPYITDDDLGSVNMSMLPLEGERIGMWLVSLTWANWSGRVEFLLSQGAPAIPMRWCALPPKRTEAEAATASVAPRLSSGVEVDPAAAALAKALPDLRERLRPGLLHPYLTALHLRDRTDNRNRLVHSDCWPMHPAEVVRTNPDIALIHDASQASGLILLGYDSPRGSRVHAPAYDLVAEVDPVGESRYRFDWFGHGCTEGDGDWSALAVWDGGDAGRAAVLHLLQRLMLPYRPDRDGLVVSNTWGDRNRDGAISEEFLTKELASGAELGVEVAVIDDGWQRGTTANSVVAAEKGGVWNGFWAADADFWSAHPERLPNGLEPLTNTADQYNIGIGLWYAPDSTDDFANWERDAAQMLDLWRRYRLRSLKLDGVKITSRIAEQRFRSLIQAVRDGCHHSMTLELDITAEPRTAYFGCIEASPLCLENRYTDWMRYWPHATLRNLWELTWWLDPLRLRMEVLNLRRNTDRYSGDPLAPNTYSFAWVLASVCASSPQVFCEVSNLSAEDSAAGAALLRVWKTLRERFFKGAIRPIGCCPDGHRLTGFASLDGAGHGIAILLREPLAAPGQTLAGLSGVAACEVLAGDLAVALHDGAVVDTSAEPGPRWAMLSLRTTGSAG